MTRSSPAPASRRKPTGSPCSAAMEPDRFFPSSRSVKSQRRFWIAWSRTLADEWRRYLQQQIELGGSEVVLSGAVTARGPGLTSHSEPFADAQGRLRGESGSSTSVQDLDKAPSEPIPRGVYPERSERARDDARVLAPPGSTTRPSWRKGAPPIPGPGLAIESPEHALLGDNLVSLTTIDEV